MYVVVLILCCLYFCGESRPCEARLWLVCTYIFMGIYMCTCYLGVTDVGCLVIVSLLESRLRGSVAWDCCERWGKWGAVYGRCFLGHYVQCMGTVDGVISHLFRGTVRCVAWLSFVSWGDIASDHWWLWSDSLGRLRSACGVVLALVFRIRLLILSSFPFVSCWAVRARNPACNSCK